MTTTAPPAESLASHLVHQTLSSIALLESLSLVSPPDAQIIRSKLPSPNGPFPSLALAPHPSQDISTPFHGSDAGGAPSGSYGQQPSVPTLPPRGRSHGPEVRARASWDYNGTVGIDRLVGSHAHESTERKRTIWRSELAT